MTDSFHILKNHSNKIIKNRENNMSKKKIIVDKFFVPENSGTTMLGKYFLSIGDDSNKIFVHKKKGKKFKELPPINIALTDAEAICRVHGFGNDNAVVAIYTHNCITEITLDKNLKMVGIKPINVEINKKVESLEYIIDFDTYVLSDRVYKDDLTYGDGNIYYVDRRDNKLSYGDFKCDGDKPTDMCYHKGILYVLHENYIERYKYNKELLKEERMKPILLKDPVKDAESLVVTNKKNYIFVDKKKP